MNRLRKRGSVGHLATLLALALASPMAHAQDGERITQGATFVRLDAVDASASAESNFVFFASFLDKKRTPIAALEAGQWTISFDGVPVTGLLTVKKLSESDAGLNLIVVLQADEALASQGGYFELARKGVKKILSGLNSRARSSAVVYGDSVDNSGALSPGHNETASWLDEKKSAGATPVLYDAIEKALETFPAEFAAVGANRAILIISDGTDKLGANPSAQKDQLQKIQNTANRRRVHLHAIGIHHEVAMAEETNRLKKLSEQSGGTWRYAVSGAELEQYLSHFDSEISGQHVLTLKVDDFEGDKNVGFQVAVENEGGKYESMKVIVNDVAQAKSHIGRYLFIAGGVLLALLVGFLGVKLVGLILRNRRPTEVVAQGPDVRACAQCTHMIPVEWKTCQYCEALPHKGRLKVTSSGEMNGQVWFIKESVTNVGSAEGNHIVIVDKSVSKRHAGIKVQDNRFELADYGSTNGVLVNGQRVTKQFLKAGDSVTIGGIELEFTLK